MENQKAWTEYEDDYIEKYYITKTDEQIANDLNTTKSRVKLRRYKLGLKKQRQTVNRQAPEGMKWCWFCNKFHPVEDFSKNRSKPDGLQDECKVAVKKIVTKRKMKKNKKNKVSIKKKICASCKEELGIEMFIKNVSTQDGYSNLCKKCLNKNSNEKYIIKENDKK